MSVVEGNGWGRRCLPGCRARGIMLVTALDLAATAICAGRLPAIAFCSPGSASIARSSHPTPSLLPRNLRLEGRSTDVRRGFRRMILHSAEFRVAKFSRHVRRGLSGIVWDCLRTTLRRRSESEIGRRLREGSYLIHPHRHNNFSWQTTLPSETPCSPGKVFLCQLFPKTTPKDSSGRKSRDLRLHNKEEIQVLALLHNTTKKNRKKAQKPCGINRPAVVFGEVSWRGCVGRENLELLL